MKRLISVLLCLLLLLQPCSVFAAGEPAPSFDETVDYSRDEAAAAQHVPNASGMYADKWGVFCHFLGYGYDEEGWNAAVDAFDVQDYAAKLHEAGAGYVILTLQQGSENICRPLPNILLKPGNETRNRLGIPCVGTRRDLPADLYAELSKYGIELYLYQATDFFTVHDEDGEDLTFKVIDDYMREYKEKGVKISGWFFDGVGGNTYRMLPLRAAVDKHDPDCAITFNTGAMQNGNGEDFSSVESYDFLSTAYSFDTGTNGVLANGEISTVCTYLSQWYGVDGHDAGNPQLAPNLPGPRYGDQQLIQASLDFIRAGGSVTYDVPVLYCTADNESASGNATGTIGMLNSYAAQLKALGDALATVDRTAPVQPPVRRMVNDNSANISYTGTWTRRSYGDALDADPYNNAYFTDYAEVSCPSGSHAGDFHTASEAGASMTVTIQNALTEKSRVVWLGRSGVKMGIAQVSVDGGEPVTVDTYGDKLLSQYPLFETELGPGEHTITITVTGQANAASQGTAVCVDAFAVYPAAAEGVTAAQLADALGRSYLPAVSDGVLSLPQIPAGCTLRFADVEPADALQADGTLTNPDKAQTLRFSLEVQLGDDTAKTDLFTLPLDPAAPQLDPAGMTATATTDFKQDGDVANLLDGDPATIWHSNYTDGSVLPQSVTLELDKQQTVSALSMLPRQNFDNGIITRYEIAVSTDGQTFTKVAAGEWEQSYAEKTVQFVPVQARFVRLTALRGVGGNQFVSCAELGLRGQPGEEETDPGVTPREPWVDDAKVGMMLHWGILSGLDGTVYEQNFQNYPEFAREVEEYTDENGYLRTRIPGWDERIAQVDVSEWVRQAKRVGADYITLAGFHSGLGYIRPWHSEIPGFPETERDILGELIEAAKKEGIRVVVYMTTSVNHAREDLYGYYRPEEYVKYAKENHADYVQQTFGKTLTDEQWEVSFNPVNNSYGFGAFTFDEIEYLMKHYDIDGFWFDAHNNPTWYKESEYPWGGGFVYDGCNGYVDADGVRQPCADPEAHKGYLYDQATFENCYFYKRDIVQFVKSMDPGCATFENNFPPNLGTEILSQETYSHRDTYQIVTPGSPVGEGLYVTGTAASGTYIDWWADSNPNHEVNSRLELQRIVHTVAAGAIATVAQGPYADGSGWPAYADSFNGFVEQFNTFAAPTYLADGLTRGYNQTGGYSGGNKADGAFVMPVQDKENSIHYLHVLTRPAGGTLELEDAVPFLDSIVMVTEDGEQPVSYSQSGGKLYIEVEDWSAWEKWGDCILKITENKNASAAQMAEYLNSNYQPALQDGRLVLPSLPGAAVTVEELAPGSTLDADGTVQPHTDTRMVTFRLLVEKDGQSARTDAFDVLSCPIRDEEMDPAGMTAAASSTEQYEPGNSPANVLDGETGTYWHSGYTDGSRLPQSLTLTLDSPAPVNGLIYTPRQGISNGYITQYEVQLSADGQTFTTVAAGE